ncbi:putative deoxynucleotide monophosphate kinase [Bradyrhizobium oligotrophicum S58]|uniref:Putative deoxynucleotide monophosphate kinase n=1 Tax=Bradyrhizobium oligotrophicum S58 TaxID=1245469 RepID=M4Z3M9_9BRAD|nr:deoxynucleotide monophosphate kinase [Bradyrhizobium oligotrophicum]BAM87669.1 putative deoxynucleotide monophosphate kinase [Bradyrhizobium oligotrophicum S58]
MIVIGIKGLIGSGKTTAARYLIEQHGFVRGRFAGALKDMLRAYLAYRGCDPATIDRMVDGDLKGKPSRWLGGQTPRHAMEWLGGSGRDSMGEGFWIGAEADKLQANSPTRVVVEDVRHANEGVWIGEQGGVVVEVVRPGQQPQDHRTERAQAAVRADLAIMNYDGDLASTERQIDTVVRDLIAKGVGPGLPPMQTQPVR